MSEQLTPEREAEIRVKLEREAKAHGSVHFVPPKAGMVRDLLAEIDRLRKALGNAQAVICHREPEREHSDYSRPAEYMHAAGCPVVDLQQAVDGS